MTATVGTCACLKVDVDTHDGMRDGVPRLMDVFAEFGVKGTFFLSYGPDNAGKAIWNVLRQRGFLKKMVKTGAPSLYGWRTILSGTLLPSRPIATAFPNIVRRLVDEGHEVGVHAWDHRLWQDHLQELDRAAVERQFAQSFAEHERLVGQRARAVAAPAWFVSPISLAVQDTLGLDYASDMRGGVPGFPELGGYQATTLQVPTTQPCLEELLTQGAVTPGQLAGADGGGGGGRDAGEHGGGGAGNRAADAERELQRVASLVLDPEPEGGFGARVLPIHAEVEGGPYQPFLRAVLEELRRRGTPVRPMRDVARDLLLRHPQRASATRPGPIRTALREIPGRGGRVFVMESGAARG